MSKISSAEYNRRLREIRQRHPDIAENKAKQAAPCGSAAYAASGNDSGQQAAPSDDSCRDSVNHAESSIAPSQDNATRTAFGNDPVQHEDRRASVSSPATRIDSWHKLLMQHGFEETTDPDPDVCNHYRRYESNSFAGVIRVSTIATHLIRGTAMVTCYTPRGLNWYLKKFTRIDAELGKPSSGEIRKYKPLTPVLMPGCAYSRN
jgi:hypothetical protein